MPLYDFTCENEHTIELRCHSSIKETTCPTCGEKSYRKEVHRVNASFQGSGTSKTENASLDMKIGKDSAKRWDFYQDKFTMKDKFMKSNPGAEILPQGQGYVAVKDEKVVDSTHEVK